MKRTNIVLTVLLMSAIQSATAGTYHNGVATTTVDVQAPMYNVDNTPLEDLDRVTLHWGGSPGTYVGSADIIVGVGEIIEHELIIQWDPGVNTGSFILYMAATATDFSGNQSDYSNELAVQFELEDSVAPQAPTIGSLNAVVSTPYGDRYIISRVARINKTPTLQEHIFSILTSEERGEK